VSTNELLERTLPTRTHPRGDAPLTALFDAATEADDARGGVTPELNRRYDGDLLIPLRTERPTVLVNFVETLDGVISMDTEGRTGGGEVSGFSPTDRFVMGLLRAMADVVLVGASAVRRSSGPMSRPGSVYPPATAAYADLRERLGLPPAPIPLIVTASGELDPGLPAFTDATVQTIIVAPEAAAERLRRAAFGSNVAIEAMPGSDGTPISAAVDVAGRAGARLIVSEAGPHLFADLIATRHVDEVFLTLAPQLAGRAPGNPRLGLVEGAALWPDQPTWTSLSSVRRGGDHLYLRYRIEETDR
jgi:riboflavin biosynthesis pyrimidine reductase